MNAVEVRDGYKYFGRAKDPKVVLNYINMTVKYGCLYGLLGPSACGKTTLLNCILGIKSLNGGSVNVLGGMPGSKKSGVPGPRVGYQPQEIALVNNFTIKETIYYFGRIFGLDIEKLRSKYSYLMKLFELPDGDRLIRECSGGQQRCVSFITSVVHSPELLILDEPTVGLDPLLREKMWSFLIQISSNSNSAIIITTHYIEEARQADYVGIMREGKLLAEDSPNAILSSLEVSTLEDGFLELCHRQEALNLPTKSVPIEDDLSGPSKSVENLLSKEESEQNTSSSKSRIKALLIRNFKALLREPAGIIFIFFFPWFQILCFYFTLGGHPKGVTLGIVSEELSSINDCYNSSLITIFSHDDTCDLHKLSCRFITEITDEVAQQRFYNSFDEAYKDAKKGKIMGIIYFAKNFTEASTNVRDSPEEADPGSVENKNIQVYLDSTNQQLTIFVKRKLLDVFQEYTRNVMSDCNFSKRFGQAPIVFEDPIAGNFNDEFGLFIAPGVVTTMIFFLTTLITCTIFIEEKLIKTWDRNLVAGVTVFEMIFSQTIISSLVMMIQCVQIVVTASIAYGISNKGSNINAIILILLQGFSGIFAGILVSVYCKTFRSANQAATGILLTVLMLCGVMWPIEGMPGGLREFSVVLPFTMPPVALRNILFKGHGFFSFSVLSAYLISIFWIAVFLILSIVGLKLDK